MIFISLWMLLWYSTYRLCSIGSLISSHREKRAENNMLFHLGGLPFCHSITNYDFVKQLGQTINLGKNHPPNYRLLHIMLLQGWVSKRFLFRHTRIVPDFIKLPSCSSENYSQNQPLAIPPLKWKELWVLSEPGLMVEVMCAIEYVTK